MRCIRAAIGGLTDSFCLGLAMSLSLTGCAGNGDGLDANGRPLAGGEPPGGKALSADFESLQSNIFTPICSVCHVGGDAPQGLRLDSANSYNLLVGVPSTEVPSVIRVLPGAPDDSYLIQKLEGHAAVGAQMPLGGPYLPSDIIAFIRQWIANGAQPAGDAAPSAVVDPLSITVSAPEANESLSEAPPQIMIGFNHDVDVTRIGAESVRIERLVGTAESPQSENIPARPNVSPANPRALMVWPSRRLAAGRYRVVMRGITGPQESVISTFDVRDLP